MATIRCPQCQLPVTRDELFAGTCPACEASLSGTTNVLSDSGKGRPAAPSSARRGRSLLVGSLAAILLLTGVAGGFFLRSHPLFSAEDQPRAANETRERESGDGTNPADPVANGSEGTEPTAAASAEISIARAETAKALNRVKELEAQNEKIRKDFDEKRKQTMVARVREEAARRDAVEANQPKAERITELEMLVEKVRQDLELQKKLTSEARAAEDAARREMAQAVDEARKPQDARIAKLEALSEKLRRDLDVQRGKATDAKSRENDAKSRENEARRSIEQVRREGQQNVKQAQNEGRQAVEAVRRELRQAQQATQRAQEEAQKQKRAADEAKRANKEKS